MKLDYGAPGRILFSREVRLPRQRLHHRRDRAAPVQLQRAAGRLPRLRRPRRKAGVRRGPRRPQPRLVDQEGRGRALGQVQPALALLHAGAELARPRLRLRPRNPLGPAFGGGARRHPPRHQGPPGHAPLRRRPQVLRGEEAVRRRHRQPQPPNAADRIRVDARGAVALPVVATVRGLRRRPPQARTLEREDRRRGHLDRHPPKRRGRLSPGSAASRASSRRNSARSRTSSSRRSTSASASSTMSGSTISTSTAPAARSPAARASASASLRRSAPASRAFSTSSTNRRSASTRRTTTASSKR